MKFYGFVWYDFEENSIATFVLGKMKQSKY